MVSSGDLAEKVEVMNLIWLALAFLAGLVCGWCFIPVPTWLPWGQPKKKP